MHQTPQVIVSFATPGISLLEINSTHGGWIRRQSRSLNMSLPILYLLSMGDKLRVLLQLGNLGESADHRDQDFSPSTADPSKGRQNKAPTPSEPRERKSQREKGPVGGSWLRLGSLSPPMPSRDKCPAGMILKSDHTGGLA